MLLLLLLLLLGWGLLLVVQKFSFDHSDACFSSDRHIFIAKRETATHHPLQTLSPIQHNPLLQSLGSQPTTSSYSPTSKLSEIRYNCVAKVPEHDVVRQR
jgi:hypothetical protein